MSEVTQDARVAPDDTTLYSMISEFRDLLGQTTPAPWSIRTTPGSDTLYISGAPDSNVVASEVALEDALAIVRIVNRLPELLHEVELLDRMMSNYSTRGAASDFLQLARLYQGKISQLSANPAPVPEASTAGDLTFMHVGSYLSIEGQSEGTTTVPGVYMRIAYVEEVPGTDLIKISSVSGDILILQKSTSIKVSGPDGDEVATERA